MSSTLHKITICDIAADVSQAITSVQWEVAIGDEIWGDQVLATLTLRDGKKNMILADLPHPHTRAKVAECFCLVKSNSAYAYCLASLRDA
tara:strand:- start:36 stop:305 length:270 start_codon:yes stop_codon:yes gene_type:complete